MSELIGFALFASWNAMLALMLVSFLTIVGLKAILAVLVLVIDGLTCALRRAGFMYRAYIR